MLLWTLQPPGFLLTEGQVDPTLSETFQTVPGASEAYRQLWLRLKTDQLIWCASNPHDRVRTGIEMIEWALEVPDGAVLALVDGFVWNRILGIKCYSPPLDLRLEWRQEAKRRFPHDPSQRRVYIKQLSEEFWSREAPPGGWWEVLFVKKADNEGTWALLRHPIPPDWVRSWLPFSVRHR